MRMIVKVGRDTRYPTFSSILPVLSDAAKRLPGMMRLTPAISMSVSRVEMLRSLLDAIKEEAGDMIN